jgi:lambda repressor-like predicted transcriptional regulator
MRLHDLVVNQLNNPPTDILPQELDFSQRRVRNRKLTRAQLQELTQDYQGGATLQVLALKYGMNRQSLSACLAREGVQRRYRVRDSQDQVDRVVTLYASGLSLVQVARQMGVDRRSVRNILLRAGVEIRANRWMVP